jgi:hypothetical protein
MLKPLVLLQNAWSPVYAGGTWPHASWFRALQRSRSGQRLRVLLGEDWTPWDFGNTTPRVAPTASGVLPPDLPHLAELTAERPYIVACGQQAAWFVSNHWDGSALVIPHPAYKVLTNALLIEARSFLQSPIGRQRLVQERKAVRWETVPQPSNAITAPACHTG